MCMVGIRPDCPCGLHFHISCYQHFPVDFIKLGLAWNEKAESLRLCSADLKKNRKQKTKKDSNHPKSWLWEQIGVYIQFLASLYTYLRHEAQLWCPGVCAARGFLWQTLGTDCSVHSALATCLCLVCHGAFLLAALKFIAALCQLGRQRHSCALGAPQSCGRLCVAHPALAKDRCFPSILALWVGFTVASLTR